ncbi:MAG: phosphomannomutase/phosphoglucomutase [Armatimonadetes bacterium]|nr:phosphomannomutase/phosphoglucomutase [Armatimonadota bacterium]
MAVRSRIFREYDIRGVVGQEIDADAAATIARAFASSLNGAAERDVVVGRDNRLSSPMLRDAVTGALVESGCRVTDVGVVISPLLYFARVHLGIDAGIMITASHNPPQYNGMKLARGFGTLHGAEIQEIRRLAEARARTSGDGSLVIRDFAPAYRQMLREKIQLARKLRVVVDCANGTASEIAPQALRDLGVDVIPLYCESDPTFPNHHPDPVDPENLTDLIDVVRQEGADLGIGFDGDGDRIGAVDDQGNVAWGDQLMILYWREILAKYPGAPAIIEVKCSQALVEEVTRLGGRPVFYKTGHSLIKAKMKEMGAPFAGEMSGHMFFADEYFGYDDAVYAAARLLRIVAQADRPMSALLADVPRYYATPETRVACPDDRKFEVVATLIEHFKAGHEVIDIDGARVSFGDGWGLVRASNTQPVIVVRAEGTTPAARDRIQAVLEAALAPYPEVGQVRWGRPRLVGDRTTVVGAGKMGDG